MWNIAIKVLLSLTLAHPLSLSLSLPLSSLPFLLAFLVHSWGPWGRAPWVETIPSTA